MVPSRTGMSGSSRVWGAGYLRGTSLTKRTISLPSLLSLCTDANLQRTVKWADNPRLNYSSSLCHVLILQILYKSPWSSVCLTLIGILSAIWGVAIDGIPIYGPFDEDGRQLTKEDLDECGGKYDSTGRYKYHMTVDPPYSLGCLRGEVRFFPDHKFFSTSIED